MELLNFVISLPDEKIKANKDEKNLEDLFHLEMENFFKRVED